MPLLAIRDLVKTYPRGGAVQPGDASGKVTVVDVREFSLEAGAQRALRGESGTGKTTFLNLIAGILAPDSGHLTLDDRDLATLGEAGRDRLRAETIGYIFQTFNLLQGHSVLENVEL
ncbi:MAG TPA: ATP-binding cassette domain-containing protein, partial [Acidobacteriota bacterium]|nr:ATP-binding cassette domain-containing protein [Acidobacteriota bacterium]